MAFFTIEVTSLKFASQEFRPIGIIEADTFPEVFEKLNVSTFGRGDRFQLPPEWEAKLFRDAQGEIPRFEVRYFPTIASMDDLLIELNRTGYLPDKAKE